MEQFEVSDEDENDGPSFSDNNLESGSSSEDPSTEYSSIGTKSGKAAVKSSEIYECAFCRTEVTFLPTGSVFNALNDLE